MPDKEDLHDLDDVAAEFGVDLRPVAGGPCARCGRNPASGYAGRWTNESGEEWYCHGDEDESPTCYETSDASNVWRVPW